MHTGSSRGDAMSYLSSIVGKIDEDVLQKLVGTHLVLRWREFLLDLLPFLDAAVTGTHNGCNAERV